VSAAPHQREVWNANLEPVIGHEQGRRRPVVVLSRDPLGRAGLAIVVPFTTKDIGSPLHLRVDVGEGGLSQTSWAPGRAGSHTIRSISPTRFTKRLGTIRPQTHAEILRRINTLVRPD
jgi:mRNA interferase MazF